LQVAIALNWLSPRESGQSRSDDPSATTKVA